MSGAAHAVRAVAFDLDGTLVDSAPDIAHALNHALQAQSLAAVELAQVRRWIGDGPDALIERTLHAAGIAAGGALSEALRQGFDDETLRAPLQHGAVFDGIVTLLAQLSPHWPVAVVTNKPTRLARSVLQAAALLPHVTVVRGADTPASRKPAPAMLTDVAAQFGVLPAQVLMVGDSPADLLCAQAAGAPAALVAWGYAHAAACRIEHAVELQRPQQLLQWLRGESLRA